MRPWCGVRTAETTKINAAEPMAGCHEPYPTIQSDKIPTTTMDLISNSLYFLGGVSSFAAVHNLLGRSSQTRDLPHIFFSGIALLVAFSAISRTFVIQSTDLEIFIADLKWNVSYSLGVILLIPWFTAAYAHKISKAYLITVSLLIAACIGLNVYLPHGLSYAHLDTLLITPLPWGEQITHGVGRPSMWGYFTIAVIALIYAKSLSDVIDIYRKRRRRVDLHILIAFVLFGVLSAMGVAVRLSLVRSFSPGALSFFVVIVIISTALMRENRRKISESERRFRTLIEQSPVGIALTRQGRLIDANPIFLKMHGYTDIHHVADAHLAEILQLRETGQAADARVEPAANAAYESTSYRIDGMEFPVYVSTRTIELNSEPHLLTYMIDQSKHKESEKKVEYLSHYDTLTGLPNKNLLLKHLRRAVESSAHNARWGALLHIDLNNFRILNDGLGHAFGDLLLQSVGKRLSNKTRPNDTVARLGSDEFAVLLTNLGATRDQAVALAEARGAEMLLAMNRPFKLMASEYHNTSRIGITLFNADTGNIEDLFKQAELAMYQAKTHRQGSICFYEPHMRDTVTTRLGLESALRKAIGKREITLHYQPQVDAHNRLVGAEALVRWKHAQQGYISPAQFIPIAEETGLILQLGRDLLDIACSQLRLWQRDERTRGLVLAINISAKQFRNRKFIDDIRATIERHAIPPENIKLELTESMLFDNIEETIESMSALKKIGIQFSLDDFGTGYSSIQYLKHLPLDELKIDQSFVRDISSNDSGRNIVRAVLAMAGALNLGVIAEGVETQQQMEILSTLGCTRFQGYLFGKPVSAAEFETFLTGSAPSEA